MFATAGWIVAGGSAAAIATAAVTGLLALRRESRLSSQCDSGVCPPSFEDDVAGYDRLRIVAFTSGTVGIALAAGAWLLLTSRSSESPVVQARKGRSAEPWVGARSVGLQWDF